MSRLRLGLGPLQLSPVRPQRKAAANQAPVVANAIPDRNASEGTPFSFQVAVNAFSDPDGDALSYAATLVGGGALPAWLTFTPATRTFSGTPGAGDFADLSIRVTATDPGGLSVHDDFLLVVNGKPVVANPIPGQQAAYNAAFSFQFASNAFTDPDGDALTYSADLSNGNPLPTWLAFTPATRTFSGTPALADLGTLQVRVTAADGSLQVTNVFSLQAVFVPANDPLASCFIDKLCTASLFDDGVGSYTGVLNNAPAPATGSWRIQSITDRVGARTFTAPSVAERITWNHTTKRFEGAGNRRLRRSGTGTPQDIFPSPDYTIFADWNNNNASGGSMTVDFGDSTHENSLYHEASSDKIHFLPRSDSLGGQSNRIISAAGALPVNQRHLVEGYVSGLNSRLLIDATLAGSKSDNDSPFLINDLGITIFGHNSASNLGLRGNSAGVWMFKGGMTTAFEALFRSWVSETFP